MSGKRARRSRFQSGRPRPCAPGRRRASPEMRASFMCRCVPAAAPLQMRAIASRRMARAFSRDMLRAGRRQELGLDRAVAPLVGQGAGPRWPWDIDPGNLQRRWAPCVLAHGQGQGQLPLRSIRPRGYWSARTPQLRRAYLGARRPKRQLQSGIGGEFRRPKLSGLRSRE